MARVRLVCPHCRAAVFMPALPSPGTPLDCGECGKSFFLTLKGPTALSQPALVDPTAAPKTSQSHRKSLWLACSLATAIAVLATWSVVTNWRRQSTPTTVASQPAVSLPETNAKESAASAVTPNNTPSSIDRMPPATDASPPAKQRQPDPIVGVLYSVNRSATDMQTATPLGTAVQVGKRHFAVRALALLTHGVKDPATDPNKLTVGTRSVVKATYHPKLPLASLSNEKLSDSELVAMILYDVAVLEIDGDLSNVDLPALVSLATLGVDPSPVVCLTSDSDPKASKASRLTGMAKRHGDKTSPMIADVEGSFLPTYDGAPVLDQAGRLLGMLLVQIDADGKPKAPHNILSWDRVAETLAMVQ